jgi:hypothetical protein
MIIVIIISLFTLGYIETYKIAGNEDLYYLFLTVVAILSAVASAFILKENFKYKIHLSAIFVLIIIGYFLKIYILGYLILHSDSYYEYINAYFPLQYELLVNSPDLFIIYFEVVTAMLGLFALVIISLSLLKLNVIQTQGIPLYNNTFPKYKVKDSSVKLLLILASLSILFIIYIQIYYNIGLVSPGEREVTILPYRLAGIIQIFGRYFIPMILFIALWLSIKNRLKFLSRISYFLFFFWGVSLGLVSTSKEPLIIAILSIFLTLFLCNAFGKKQMIWLIALIPLLMLFNDFLSLNRLARNYYLDEGIVDIAIMIFTGIIKPSDFLSQDYHSISSVAKYLGLIMRIGGADSLLSILDYNMTEPIRKALLFQSSQPIVDIFTQDVLGQNLMPGLRFSPSLLGYFILALGGVSEALIAFVLYVLFWHIIFTSNFKSKFRIKSFLALLLLLTMIRLTSEGGFSRLSMHFLLIIIFGVVGELLLKRVNR